MSTDSHHHHHGSFPHATGDIESTGPRMEAAGLPLYRLRDGIA